MCSTGKKVNSRETCGGKKRIKQRGNKKKKKSFMQVQGLKFSSSRRSAKADSRKITRESKKKRKRENTRSRERGEESENAEEI